MPATVSDENPLHIRQATPQDVALLHTVCCASYLDHYTHLWTPAGLQAYLERHYSHAALQHDLAEPQRCTYLLAIEGSEAIGAARQDGSVEQTTRSEQAAVVEQAVGFAKINWAVPVPGMAQNTSDARLTAELQKIYFRGAAVGKGYGGRMLAAVVQHARRQGMARVWLDVLKTNPAAQRFYERHGFRQVGEAPFATDLGEIGFWVMVCNLETPTHTAQ